MIAWLAPKGLGDAIYLRALVLHSLGEQQIVFTLWDDVFYGLEGVEIRPLSEVAREHEYRLSHAFYCLHCKMPELGRLSQFQMMCRQGGVTDDVELRLGWSAQNKKLLRRVRGAADGRPILLYQMPKRPRNIEQSLLAPDMNAFVDAVRSRDEFFRVRVGSSRFCDDVECPREYDLFDNTTVSDLLDLTEVADRFLSEPCYLSVVAQAVDKPFECMFSRRGLASNYPKISGVTPERLFHKPHLGTALYDGGCK